MTLFNEEAPKTEGVDNNNNDNTALQTFADTIANKLMAIKREDGTPKYENIEQALDALAHSQNHIRTLEGENSELKTTVGKVSELEKRLSELSGSNRNQEPPAPKTQGSGGLSEEAVRDMLKRELENEKKATTSLDNLKNVNNALIQKYGSEDKAKEAVKLKAKELDMSLTELEELSKVKPKAVLAYFGASSPTPVSTNSSTVRLPNNPSTTEQITRPEKSLLSGPGATGKNQIDYYRRIRENVMKKLERGELG